MFSKKISKYFYRNFEKILRSRKNLEIDTYCFELFNDFKQNFKEIVREFRYIYFRDIAVILGQPGKILEDF